MRKGFKTKNEKQIFILSWLLFLGMTAASVCIILLMWASVERAENIEKLESARGQYESYINDFSNASDYMTQEIWSYATDGKLSHLFNYWREIHTDRNRDKAIQKLLHAGLTEQENTHVMRAKAYSDSLIQAELKSLRLLAAYNRVDESRLPADIRDAQIGEDQLYLTPPDKGRVARSYLFGGNYMESKQKIREMVESFREDLSYRLEYETENALQADRAANHIAAVVIALLLGMMAGMLWFYTSTMKRKNTELEQSFIRAEASSRSKSYFTSRMSHEMRTPLNAVLGYLRMGREAQEDGRQEEYLRKSELAARTLLSIVNDVLDLSAIENGKMSVSSIPFRITDLLGKLGIIYEGITKEKGITFRIEQEQLLQDEIFGDEMRMNQVLTNLMSNAIKFTPEGGTIVIRVSQSMAGQMVRTCYTVQDTGIGMSKEFLPHLYEPYEQENNIHQKFGGTGLGMSIVKNLVEMMGGTVAVESELGKGTTFTICMTNSVVPAEKSISAAQLAAAEQPVPDTKQSLKGLRVLIAEDNAMNMEIALHILRKAGIEATAACNGKLAAELYETGADYAFDAILMDIIMPEMGGYEATRRIRESMKPDAATIPIIAMSANAFASDMEQSRAAGMNAHLAKPVDVTKLYQTLQEYCHRK